MALSAALPSPRPTTPTLHSLRRELRSNPDGMIYNMARQPSDALKERNYVFLDHDSENSADFEDMSSMVGPFIASLPSEWRNIIYGMVFTPHSEGKIELCAVPLADKQFNQTTHLSEDTCRHNVSVT